MTSFRYDGDVLSVFKLLTPVVRRVDNATHRINHGQWIAWFVLSTLIRWIAIYPVDSVIQPLNNRGPSDVNLCRTVVDLFVSTGKSSWKWIVFPDGQISDELFVPFAHQTICSSETICPSIWFVRPLVWKRPMGLITNGLQPSRSSCTAMEFMQTAKD